MGSDYHSTNKPCRYGLECSRPNCKFTHGPQFIRHVPTSTGITSKHWVPLKIHMKNKSEGGVICATADSEDDAAVVSFAYSICARQIMMAMRSTHWWLLCAGLTTQKWKPNITIRGI